MRWLFRLAVAWCLGLVAFEAPAPDFKMADGAVITGALVAPNDDGTVIRRSSGGLTSRLGWDKFAQETLRELSQDEKLKELVEAYIDAPESEMDVARPEIVVKDPPGKVARPAKRPHLFGTLFSTSAGWLILGVVMLANLYAAYAVSVFRNYPAAAVMGTSLILPVAAPILFLCLPTRVTENVELEAQFEAPQEVPNTGAQALAAAGLGGSGLSLSAGHKAAPPTGAPMQPATYKRQEVEFNRQFFEKTFPLFFRIARADSDKAFVLAIRSSKGEVVGTRISRISGSELGLITLQGHEVQVRFGDIGEVHLRPRTA